MLFAVAVMSTSGKLDRHVYDEKNTELKLKYKLVRRGYEEMEQFAGLSDDDRTGEFTDPRVIDLWLRMRGMGLPQSAVDQMKVIVVVRSCSQLCFVWLL